MTTNVSQAVQKAARLLLARAQSAGERTARGILLQMDVTKQDMASSLGLTREEATRAIGALKREGVLAMEGSTLIVLDEKALEALAR